MPWRSVIGGLFVTVATTGCDGCDAARSASSSAAASASSSASSSSWLSAQGADAGAAGRLTPEQARQVLARVGERVITLGDYAAALERMDPFERMRYQTEDRRQALLDEMINVELLASEAERRGLDRSPETIELVRQFQRDELLARLRASLPRPSDVPAAEVSQYYQDHRAEFREPEQRRAAEIVVRDASEARRLVRDASGASPERWRELVQKYAPASAPGADSADKTTARPPIDVAGDLGFLGAEPDAPDDGVPAAVRTAVFQIEKVGDVYPEPVAALGGQHVVRLVSVREARQRSLAEVDTFIRVRLVEAKEAGAREALLARLRQTVTVTVDVASLEGTPPVAPSAAPAPGAPARLAPSPASP
jgi:peptidyl-prolyl cis-trans isomerase C